MKSHGYLLEILVGLHQRANDQRAARQEVAEEHAVSKQRVGQIVQRWGAWAVQAWGSRRVGPPDRPAPVRRVRRGRPKTHVLTFRVDAETASLLELRRKAGIPIPTRSVHDMARALLMEQVHGGACGVR